MVSPLHVLPLVVFSLPLQVVPAERGSVERIYLFDAPRKLKPYLSAGCMVDKELKGIPDNNYYEVAGLTIIRLG